MSPKRSESAEIPLHNLQSQKNELARLDAALSRLGGGSDPFAAAVWATRMPIVVTNPRENDNPMVFVNDAFCNLTGYARDEILGRNCRFLQGPATDPAKVALLREAVGTARPLDIEIRNYRKDGTPFWNRLHMVPLHDGSGALTYFFASQLDVTIERERLSFLESHNAELVAEREARRHADAANAEKSRFLAVASHDIRQPLQSLVLLQGILAHAVHGDAAEKLVERLGQTLDSMSGMLNSLLDLNQIEAGAVRTEVAEFRINDILDRLRDGFAYDAEAKELTLHVVPCALWVRSDPRLLEQMIRNLLSNALKYTRRGKVLLGCRRRGAKLSIEVWDTGIGIPEEGLGAVFGEYHQIDTAERRSSPGLGLGLSIVHRFASLLGHDVRVRSELGRGSIFAIEVLLAVASESQARDLQPQIKDGLASGSGSLCSILLIDDDPETGDILESFLKDEGFRVLAARDSLQALKLVDLEGFRPDLLVTDSSLPTERSGPEITARLRDRFAREIPIITLTGDVSTQTLRETDTPNCLRLTKPVKLRELTNAIERLLARTHGVSASAVARQPAAQSGLGSSVVFVVDDNIQVSDAIRDVVEAAGGEVESYATSEAFLKSYRLGRRGCLLVDAYLPGMNGIGLLRHLRDRADLLPAIMITGNSDVQMAVQAMKAGASDFIEKPVSSAELLASIERALNFAEDKGKVAERREAATNHVAQLTHRQRQIMEMVLAGQPSKNIAADLGISQRTVENHRASIMRKTGVKSLPALARLAVAASWNGVNGTLGTISD